MLTVQNLPALLDALGFTSKGQKFTRIIGASALHVLLDEQRIEYPEADGLVINERQTCNFSAAENFVVLECVIRLLEKGYKPQHIELEPKWQLGRGASGGRADILVKDNHGKPLLIIECKTAGSEFKRAWTKTMQDGDQLFSYTQQISDTQFLCLYTADLAGGAVAYTSHLIAHRDNERYLADNPLFKSFRSATDVKERHAIWRDTYKLDYTTKGLFEPNIQPYHIGKNKYTLDDLQAISAADQQGKYHEYATILRQHNVAGRENAFDKLVNLFLCKLVDEIENPDDLKFYWKGVAYDTHFELLDRLQQLYQRGMGRFLGESITYINQADVNNALRFVRQNPDATQRAVWNLFVQQKFFTNNDFSLIDVHNEKLFYQNAEVLLRILQMWQDIRLSNPEGHNQFLGDMFEGFLDQGVKQSEGQYFTPMPICRFILMSLPLESIVKNSATPPKAIDYACGAGHFLNELALQLKPLVEQHRQTDMTVYHQAIHGIEKEYRLSKVAKVSAFMYGQQDINICHGDALVKQHAAYPQIQDGTFDLLVANPPFSVRGFLETLPEADRAAYTLSDTVDKLDTNNSIETFFLERAKQLLKAGGVAAIILPSSVLSNANGTYIRAREILLQYFDIVAIVEFGSGTFGKTGTNTVTLFLRRKPTTPDTAAHYLDRLNEWFGADEGQAVYRDGHLIDAYAAHIGVPAADYKGLLQGDADGAWADHDHFEQYKKKFNDSGDVERLSKQRAFKALSAAEREGELRIRFLSFAQVVERDKLYHFVMASDQAHLVLIIRSPTDSKAQKQFLGYDWSTSKGDEGIKVSKDSSGAHLTPLYNELNRADAGKLNRLIAANFEARLPVVPVDLSELARFVPLVDLVDFSRPAFEKQIVITAGARAVAAQVQWASNADLVPLDRIAQQVVDRIDPQGHAGSVVYVGLENIESHTGRLVGNVNSAYADIRSLKSSFQAGDLLYGKLRPNLNKVYLAEGSGICSTEILVLRFASTAEATFYRDYLLTDGFNGEVLRTVSGQQLPRTSWESLRRIRVPKLSATKLELVSAELLSSQAACDSARADIDESSSGVDALVNSLYTSSAIRRPIDEVSLVVQYGLNEQMNEAGIGYKIFRMNEVVQRRMVDGGQMKCADISAEEFAKYKLSRGDLLFNRTNGSIEQVGKVGMFDLDGDYCFASYLVRVVPDSSKVIPHFLCLMMNAKAFRDEARGQAVKSAGQININATKMRNIKVPVPPMAEQKRLVAKVQALEKKIADAQAVIAAAPARKQAILQRYL